MHSHRTCARRSSALTPCVREQKKCTDCDIFPALKDGRIDPKVLARLARLLAGWLGEGLEDKSVECAAARCSTRPSVNSHSPAHSIHSQPTHHTLHTLPEAVSWTESGHFIH